MLKYALCKGELGMFKEEMRYPSIDTWENYYIRDLINNVYPKKTVYQEVVENNQDYPNDLAIEFFGSKINFKDFEKRINETAKSFCEYGIKKGDFVTICAAGIPETVYSFYALSKIGAISNMIAPHFDKDDFIKRISDCESDILIVMDIFYDEIKEAVKKSRIKKIIVLPTMNSSILRMISKKYKIDHYGKELFWNDFIKDGRYNIDDNVVSYEPDMPLTMVYSSGTTGASKGILLSNDSFQNSIHAYLPSGVEILRGQKFYQIIPTWYSTGISTSVHLPLVNGSAVFMDPRFERNVFVKNILKYKPNYTIAPTSMYEGFLDEKLVGKKDLAYFKYPFEGGEPLPKAIAEKISDVFHQHGSEACLQVGYGQCECGATITTQTPKTEHCNGSVGIPLPGVIIKIVDDHFTELPFNHRGQIIAHTPCSMIGYFHNEEATKAYFFVDKDGLKWNCTGDIGYIKNNGELFVEGRIGDYSNIDGEKIYNFDIEKILMSLPEIKICDVFEKQDDNGDKTLVAHIILDDSFKATFIDSDNLFEELKLIQKKVLEQSQNLNMVPEYFKIRDSFPYAKSGKRDIEKLKKEETDFIYINKNYLVSKVKKLSK